ncbi:MAG: hypothetical protein HFH94_16900 [Lachnospiraceae bacterium]|nr:hypothetical protein [uncultured Acetatifactor sp.]MCI9221367.1 hypothetical protein [Lachnospiraceae bacterium]
MSSTETCKYLDEEQRLGGEECLKSECREPEEIWNSLKNCWNGMRELKSCRFRRLLPTKVQRSFSACMRK